MKDSFTILSLSREDFEAVGFIATELDDETMEYIARKLGDVLMSGGDYWLFLEQYAEENDLPRTEENQTDPGIDPEEDF